jgi:hypothetical protein
MQRLNKIRHLCKFDSPFDKPRRRISKKLIRKCHFDNFILFKDVTLKMNYQFNDVA